MSSEHAAHLPDDTHASSVGEAAAMAHDFASDETYFDELWREAATADQQAQTILTMANILANGDPTIRRAVMQGYLAQTALKRRHEAIQELTTIVSSTTMPAQRSKPAA